MIIGITGTNGSGKDTAAAFFEQYEFIHLSLSEGIRDELRKEGRVLTKENQIEKGIQLRKQFGNDVLAHRVLEQMKQGKKYVVTSIRHRQEISCLKQGVDHFVLVHIDAEPLLRFQRAKQRVSATIIPESFEEFLALDKKEEKSDDHAGQEIAMCAQLADITIWNNGTKEAFKRQLSELLERFRISTTSL